MPNNAFLAMRTSFHPAIALARVAATESGEPVTVYELYNARTGATRYGSAEEVEAATEASKNGTLWMPNLVAVVHPELPPNARKLVNRMQEAIDLLENVSRC